MSTLIITADDYGYFPSYDEGILELAREGRLDAVSAFSMRPGLRPEPLIETGVEIGLHLDLAAPGDAPRAREADRERAGADIWMQYERFIRHFGRPPAYIDGHHHSHAREGLGVVVADIAVARDLPVRSKSERQRRLLRCRGVATPDLLIGRTSESEPFLPPELTGGGGDLPPVVEWMVHPGYPAGRESRYDRGREEEIGLLREWEPPAGVVRASHRDALGLGAPPGSGA